MASAACSAADMLELVKEAWRARGAALISAVAPLSLASSTTVLPPSVSDWLGLGSGSGSGLGLGSGLGSGLGLG